jgi:hypothetical protein
MRNLLIAVLALVIATANSDGASSDDSNEIRSVILEQMEAFRQDDGAAAFAIAAPEIQTKFGDPERFMAIVAAIYPQVYRPQKVTFLDLNNTGDDVVQKVLLIGPNGRLVIALYQMIEINGHWRIKGCALITPPEKAI